MPPRISPEKLTEATYFVNHGLFSNYYLNERAQKLADWESTTLHSQARQVRDELRALYAEVNPAQLSEAQLEARWIQPVLEKLGHHWAVQVKLRYRDTGHRRPDYVLLDSAADANAFTNKIYLPDELRHVRAVMDAKSWGKNFDRADQGDRNPSQQIDEYLRYSEVRWGVLTDGQHWRLYEQNTSRDNDYYAVDLVKLLNEEQVNEFLYFFLFFRREAFAPQGWLEQVLRGSADYAEGLSERLEEEVFSALEMIAQGFFSYRRNRLQPTPETLKQVYEESLVLLYRLLFILYAESREILPMSNPVYRDDLSLRAGGVQMRTTVGAFEKTSVAFDVDKIYSNLSTLFFFIDSGSPEYGIHAYNGRLFSETEHPFLAKNRLGDAFLYPALDLLMYVPPSEYREALYKVAVDYRALDVRHLGAIYEKLLEYELDVATVDLTEKSRKVMPAAPGDKVVKKAGEVYLRTGSHERKVTGSYYTPDYVVRFIVRQTLEPLLDGISRQHADLDSEGHWQVRNADALRREIMALNILDPATGSGHFMVEAVAQLANWLTALNLHPADVEEGEDELTYWKRQVVNACIYGVDLNRLAVELAKLSLWLSTVARGRPLSFLDNHLKHGNSLVGARTRGLGLALSPAVKAGADPQPLLMAETQFVDSMRTAVDTLAGIETTAVHDVGDVKTQETRYASMDAALEPWRALADVQTARHFGLTLTQSQWAALYHAAANAPAGTADPFAGLDAELRELVAKAHALKTDHRFLHWELAFPEVFFAPDGTPLADGGFDAVIGNPPYVRQERIQPYKDFFAAAFETYSGTADLYLYFYEQALKLVKTSRRVGFITSGTFMNSNSAAPFRKYIQTQAAFDAVIDFGAVQPFKGADLATNAMIAVFRRGREDKPFRAWNIEGRKAPASLTQSLKEQGFDCSPEVVQQNEWRFQDVRLMHLFQKIIQGRQTLDQLVSGKFYSGIKTGLNDAFIIDTATRDRLVAEHGSSAEIIKPMLSGEDLRPWYQENSGQYLIFTRRGIKIDDYPAVKQHLESFREKLEPKPANWTAKQGQWSGRKAGPYQWYEVQDVIGYFEEFEKPKIVWPDIGSYPRFSWNEGSYLNNTSFFVSGVQPHLLALMQSRVNWFAISQIATPLNIRLGLWRYRLFTQFLGRLPIPILSATQQSAMGGVAEEITALARQRYALHEDTRQMIDLTFNGDKSGKINTALGAWWELEDFSAFQKAVKASFKRDLPSSRMVEWAGIFKDRVTQHQQLTAQIVTLETNINRAVYLAFDLTGDEIALVEAATKYPYGAV